MNCYRNVRIVSLGLGLNELLELLVELLLNCHIIRFWWYCCIIVRYVAKSESESESGSVEQKGGWWQEESKITYDMTQNRMWWFHKKDGFEGAGVQSVQAEEEREDMLFWSSTKRRHPRNCRGQPNWNKRRGRWINNVMACNNLE